ncbi:MAG TPA: hypothetical protein VMH40_09370 [Myxococcaceae bacterium]|nr:hypothetical protein [Myxococcaceae bacterium]
MRCLPCLAAGALALAAGCASTGSTASPSAAVPATARGATLTGSIQNYTSSPSGQVNGFVLASGERVAVPEDLGPKVSDQFPPNTTVQVTGRLSSDSEGRTVLEADRITAPTRNVTLDVTKARAAPPSPEWGPAVGGSGPAGTEPVNPPPADERGAPGTPPPTSR